MSCNYFFRVDSFRLTLILLQALAVNAALGLLITIMIALPIVILSTANIYVGFLCALNIVFCVLAVISMLPIIGWELGVKCLLNYWCC